MVYSLLIVHFTCNRFDLGSGEAVIRSTFSIAANIVHVVNATR